MDKQTGPAVGGPAIIPCGSCFSRTPKDDMTRLEGDFLCKPCFGRVKSRRSQQATQEDAPPKRRREVNELTLRDVPASRAQLDPADEEKDRVRNQLIQLEHNLRRRPNDPNILSEIADLYDVLGDDDQAALCRRDLFAVDPAHPGLRGKIIADKPKMEKAPATAIPFWEDIPGILSFPLRGRGLSMVLVGGVLFGFALWIARYSIFGWILSGGVFGFLWAYWFSVISSAGTGVKEPPEWPEFFDIWHTIVWPAIVGICIFFISMGPAFALLMAIIAGPLTFNVITVPILGLLVLAGFLTYPMVLMVYSIFNSLAAAASYKFVYTSILKILPDYILFLTAYCVLSAMAFATSIAIAGVIAFFLPIPVIGTLTHSILQWTAWLYFSIAGYRLLGHLYHQSQGRLGWFEERTEPERSLNLAIVLAGVSGAVVASVAGLAAVLIIPGLLLGAAGVGDLPFRGGTYLEYSEFDSDWGWSELRYDVAEVPEGFEFSGYHAQGRVRNPIPGFAVYSDGRFRNGTTDLQSGPIFSGSYLRSRDRVQTIFLGPKDGWIAGPHVNGYTIIDKTTWKGWEVLRVDDKDTFTKLIYDMETGYLVGVNAQGLGRDLWCVLTDTNIPGLRIPPEALVR